MSTIRSWEQLGRCIANMTPEQRRQPVQCVLPTPDGDAIQELLPGIAISTIEKFGIDACRSSRDNKYHADEVVLLLDHNPFTKEGVFAWEQADAMVEDFTPIYLTGKPTPEEEQRAPVPHGE